MRIGDILSYVLLAVVSVFLVFPVVWIFLGSIKTETDIMTYPPKWVFEPYFGHYPRAWTEENYYKHFGNSLIFCATSVPIVLLLAAPAAYAFARFRIRRKQDMLNWILSARMFPALALVLPLFLWYRNLGLYDTHIGLILAYVSMNLPLAIWLLKGFFEEVPRECEEAAMTDGCTTMQAILRITLPLAAPGLAATAVLCMIFIWNDLVIALTLSFMNTKTVSIAVATFIGYHEVHWGEMYAGAIISMIPVIIFAILVQKYILRGLTFGIIKK